MQLQTGEFQIKAEDATYKEFISQVREALALKQMFSRIARRIT